MSNIKHSPSPWTREAEPYDSYREIYNAWGDTIAKVEAWDGDNDPEVMAEAEANARLITAAPATANTLAEFADAVEAYLVHGDVNLAAWIAIARKQVAIAYGDSAEAVYQDAIIAKVEAKPPLSAGELKLLAALKLCERALEQRDPEAEEYAAKQARAVIAEVGGRK